MKSEGTERERERVDVLLMWESEVRKREELRSWRYICVLCVFIETPQYIIYYYYYLASEGNSEIGY